MKTESDKQSKILTIPNLLSFFRLCLIPVFMWLYCVEKNYLWTGIILLISGLTDTVDGIRCKKIQHDKRPGQSA